MQRTVPGVTIISRPGSTPSINFRGRGNLGTSAPLYVIDGAIADATVFSNLDPNTIESISFLKDAASSAIVTDVVRPMELYWLRLKEEGRENECGL